MAIGSNASDNYKPDSNRMVRGNMRLLKITNPNWLLNIAPRISEFARHLKEDHIPYEQLSSYLAMSIQKAHLQRLKHDTSEFWVVIDNNEPKAFAHWGIRDLPNLGKVYMDGIYSWSRSKKAVEMLVQEFIEFGKKHRCTIYEFDCINKKVYDIFKTYANKLGYDFNDTGRIHCIGRKMEDKK